MQGQFFEIFPGHDVRLTETDFNLIRDTAHGIYVEVGTLQGGSAYAASFNAKIVYTIDVFKHPHLWEEPHLRRRNILFFNGTSEDFARIFSGKIDVLFIDGAHEYDYVSKDIAALSPFVPSGGHVLFHDYHNQSLGVKPAVDEWIGKIKPTSIIQPIPNICKILKVQIP